MKKWLIIILFLSGTFCHAQEFEILDISQDDGKVKLSFTLTPRYLLEKYDVELFSSKNDFATPLQYVTGDKQIEVNDFAEVYELVWDAKKEYTAISADIQLEIRGKVTYTPIHLTSAISKAKHGKTVVIEWQGGSRTDLIKIELLRRGQLFTAFTNVNNIGLYQWNVTSSVPPGDAYSIQITNLTNPQETSQSESFSVGRKSSKIGLIAGIVGAGALVAVLIAGSGGGDGGGTTPGTPPGDDRLPDPPSPGG